MLPGAEPFDAVPEGWGRGTNPGIGVLLCHGFTGSPQSMRPWAEHLLRAGYRISVPLLPGHGTHWSGMQDKTWQQWYAELDCALQKLLAECRQVFVMGLSLGGGLALRLAEEHGDALSGVVLVNPSVKRNQPRELLAPLLSRVVASLPGIASDIKKSGVAEVAYDRVPLKGVAQLLALWTAVTADLPKVRVPVLLFRSTVDHVVHPSSSATVLARIASADVREVLLEDSYHVATLDNDAPAIFEGSVEFVRRLTVVADSAGKAAEAQR
jgi:carboxylesterase